jgi:outer membrane lipoprotein LolB
MIWRVGLCVFLTLIGGCAIVAKHKAAAGREAKWTQRQKTITHIEDFSLQARVASGGVLGARGDLRWEQHGPEFQIRFSGPFGIGAVSIAGTVDNVEIRTRKNTYQTDDPEAFLAKKLGWSLPVRGLRYWVLGLPSPDSKPKVTLDDEGRAATLEQDGWVLNYTEYDVVEDHDLPSRFEIKGARSTFRIVIDEWSGIANAKD